MERLYLDVCALKRPFDDQRQRRIRREARAVADVLERAQAGRVQLLWSPAHLAENQANPREDRRLAVAAWLEGAERVELDAAVENRARAVAALGFAALGFAAFDALHLAFGERAGATWFVTCDDKLQKRAARYRDQLKVCVVGPEDARLRGEEGE